MPSGISRGIQNWRTTLAGAILAAQQILPQLAALVDGDAATSADWNAVVAAVLTFAALLCARDAGVSSKELGLPT